MPIQPIVLCVPWMKLTPKHEDHLDEWYARNAYQGDFHYVRRFRVYYKATHQVQTWAVDYARRIEASHILFTEDDHWGYPVDGLQHLLEADVDVIGFRTYFKEYPFKPMFFRRRHPTDSLIEMNVIDHVERGDGPDIQEVDLISWAFTLVRMSVFDRMRAAGKTPFRQWGPHPTDSFFCQYCADLEIKVWAHFGYTIAHGDVAPDQVVRRRRLHEVEAIERNRTLRMPSQIVVRDDHGNPYGLTGLEPEGTKQLLNDEPPIREGELCVS